MDFQLTDRVVVITGAGSGIGLATAKTFLAEGAKVVAADLDPSAAGELSESVTALAVDMSGEDAADFVIAETMRIHGRVDVLVNNVGAFPFRESFLAVSDAEWHELMNLNFYSAVRACRAALPHMVEQGRGAIVSVASDVGRAPDRFFVDYSVSKAAILMMSKAISIEFGPCRSSLQLRLAGSDANSRVGSSGWLRRLVGRGIRPRERVGDRSFRQGSSKTTAAEGRRPRRRRSCDRFPRLGCVETCHRS